MWSKLSHRQEMAKPFATPAPSLSDTTAKELWGQYLPLRAKPPLTLSWRGLLQSQPLVQPGKPAPRLGTGNIYWNVFPDMYAIFWRASAWREPFGKSPPILSHHCNDGPRHKGVWPECGLNRLHVPMGRSQLSSAFYIPADELIFHEGKKRNLGLMGPAWGQQWGGGATMGWVTEDHRGRKLASWKMFPSLVLWGPVHEIM